MTHLNNIASVTELDYLSTEEISNIIVDYVIKIMGSGLKYTTHKPGRR